MEKSAVIKVVVALEWEMFQQVKGLNGRAACQDNLETFIIMRSSQFDSWEENVVESYLADLIEAKKSERNLVMEKYAYMMEQTDPAYYANIAHLLPKITDKAQIMIDKILVHYEAWVIEFAAVYPNIRKNGRSMDGANLGGRASLLNYLKCELKTYSERTLAYLVESIMKEKELNRYWVSMEKMAQAYGYESLEEAEEALK